MPKHPKKPPMEIIRLNKVMPRLELAAALEATGGHDEADLAKLLRSDYDAKKNISTLARQIGIPFERVVRAYRDMKRLEGTVAMAQRLPKIMEDVAIDAESRLSPCVACKGTGRITIGQKESGLPERIEACIPCEGTGQVRQSGDPVARKQVLEVMELVGKGSLNVSAPGGKIGIFGSGALEDTLRLAQRGTNGIDRDVARNEGDELVVEADS